jgi:steroid delta-isomerase-like uncharacterized protein
VPEVSAGETALHRLATAWLDAFNAHDLPRLVALYAEDCVHTSPKLRARRPETKGEVRGKAALTDWWADALQRLPSLKYVPVAITAGEGRVVLEYVRHVDGEAPLPVAEVFEVRDGKIAASHVFHG